jgi:ribose 5-phosphate isomerase A
VSMDPEQQKAVAAREAAQLVENGQLVGLGTGTTVAYLLDALGDRVRAGLQFRGVPTSEETARTAERLGISLTSLDQHLRLDIAIDGADEVDRQLRLIKGRGGALLREKIVASAAERMIVIVDESKLVDRLGQHFPVPVEVVPFGWKLTQQRLDGLGLKAKLRGETHPYRTDNGNFIIDCQLPPNLDAEDLSRQIKLLPGVVEHGLFLGMASLILAGHPNGSVSRLSSDR